MCKVSELLSGEKPVFVEFYAKWCPHCQRMQPVIEQLQRKVADSIKLKTFDIDDPKNQELVNYYRIETIPTMMFFKEKEMVWRQSGEMELGQLEKVVGKKN